MGWTRAPAAKKKQARRTAPAAGKGFPIWRTLLLALGVSAAGFGVGYLIAVFILFPSEEVIERGIPVPDLIGLSVEEATSDLDRLGLLLGGTRPIRTPEEAPGVVIAQSPIAGQQLLAGASVSLGVSAGPPSIVLPNLVGMSIHSAGQLLGALGAEISSTQTYSDAPLGRVLRTEPAAGGTLANPPRVLLVVSGGPEPAPVGGDSTAFRP